MTETLVSVNWLRQNLLNTDLIILDASLKENKAKLKSEYEGVRIPGAHHFNIDFPAVDPGKLLAEFPKPEIFAARCRALGINNRSTIVVYDNLGIYSAPRLWWMFKTMGHNKVAVLDGGLPAWAENGFETETETEKNPETGDFQADYQPQLITGTEEIIKNLSSGARLLMDARTEGRFTGLAPEPRAGLRSGHIPNSVNLPFSRVLKNGKFLPREELSSLFEELNPENKSLIFSCGSGITACILFLACEMVSENDKSVYNGSWTEYAQTEGLPIVNEHL